MQHKKLFSLEEARQALQQVRGQVGRIPQLKRQLDWLGYDPHKKQYTLANPESVKPYPPSMGELARIVTDLQQQGIVVKDLDQGLIDFPHRRANGDEVYLCWKAGEGELQFWHTMQGGFAGRKPVSEL